MSACMDTCGTIGLVIKMAYVEWAINDHFVRDDQ